MKRRCRLLAALAAATIAVLVLGAPTAIGLEPPSVSVPQLQTPVPVPSLPQAPAPTPSLPSAPTAPNVDSPSGPSLPSLGAQQVGAPSGGGGSQTRQAPTGTAAPSGSTGGGPASGSAQSATPAAEGSGGVQASSDASSGAAAASQAQEGAQRRFQRSLERLETCFYAISGFERRVLVLRGGLRGRSPLSREAVAERLNVGTDRVTRAERHAVTRLREEDRSQGCGRPSFGAGAEEGTRTVVDASEQGPQLAAVTELATTASRSQTAHRDGSHARSRGQGAVLAALSSSSKQRGRHGGGGVPTAAVEDTHGQAVLFGVLAACLLLAALAGFLVRRQRDAAYSSPYVGSYIPPTAWPDEVEHPSRDDWGFDDEPSPPPALRDPPPWGLGPETSAPPPPRESPETPVPVHSNGRGRTAGVVASGIASVVVGRLLGRFFRHR
jgi:hypothetical protein